MAVKKNCCDMENSVSPIAVGIEFPTNWKWAHLSNVYKFIDYRGKTPTKTTEGIPLITAKNIKKGYLDYSIAEYISTEEYQKRQTRGISRKGDILFTTEAPMGNVAIADLDVYSAGQRVITFQKFDKTSLFVNKCYFFYMLSDLFQSELYRQKTGSTVEGIKAEKLMRFLVPLIPINEQHRIVDRIESLFAKLDEAKEKAQAVVDGFEDRKAAILHKAFTGELTEAWSKQHDECFRKTVTIKSICSSLSYGTASKSSKEGDVAVIRMGNLQGGEIDWNNLVYSNNVIDNQKYRLTDGDVLFNRTNSAEQVGKTSIYRGERPAIYAGYLIKLNYDRSVIIGDYLNYLLNSPEARDYCNRVKSDAVNQSNINAQKIGAFEIPLISIEEQRELVRLVSEQIKAAQIVKESALNSISAIDSMKNSILAKAFRGELGTNDPTELPVDIM